MKSPSKIHYRTTLLIITLLAILAALSKANEEPFADRASKEPSASKEPTASKEPSAAQFLPPLKVVGNQIYQGNQPKSLAGNSLFWSNTGWRQEKFYNPDLVRWLQQDWHTRIIRCALGADYEGSYLEDPKGNFSRLTTVIDAAIDNNLYVIIDFHSHKAHEKQAQALAFFQKIAARYGSNNHIIYEIYNEPLKVSWSEVIKPYAETVIAAIREIDPDNLIIVGTPNWSQDVDVASQDPIEGYTNIAYALHFYAGSHGAWLRDKAQRALDQGIALMVTEWGAVNANGDGKPDIMETHAWMAFLKSRKISHVNWAISDKVEGASILKPGAPAQGHWYDSHLTQTGVLIKEIITAFNQ